MACPVDCDLQDEDWTHIVYEVMMNYSIESMRSGYQELKKKQGNVVDPEALRELGYTEEDIAKRTE